MSSDVSQRLIEVRHEAASAVGAGSVWNSMVFADAKVVFVNVSKNASTSLKWLMAEISGQDAAAIQSVMGLAPTRQQTIHRRASWVDVPKLSDLDETSLAEISPSNGWFVFGVVRDPRLRTWSAWQSKFLVGNPRHYWRKFQDEPWLPRVPQRAEDVEEDFSRFVRVLASDDGARLLKDSHFTPQVEALREDVVPYSHLYEVSELTLLLTDLEEHLVRQGFPGRHELARENETPLSVSGRVFTPEVVELLEEVYARDLARFGGLWNFDKTLSKDPVWPQEAFRDIAGRSAFGQRIADLDAGAAELREALRNLERSHRSDLRMIRQLEDRVTELEAALERRTLRGLPRAVAGRLRRSFSSD